MGSRRGSRQVGNGVDIIGLDWIGWTEMRRQKNESAKTQGPFVKAELLPLTRYHLRKFVIYCCCGWWCGGGMEERKERERERESEERVKRGFGKRSVQTGNRRDDGKTGRTPSPFSAHTLFPSVIDLHSIDISSISFLFSSPLPIHPHIHTHTPTHTPHTYTPFRLADRQID